MSAQDRVPDPVSAETAAADSTVSTEVTTESETGTATSNGSTGTEHEFDHAMKGNTNTEATVSKEIQKGVTPNPGVTSTSAANADPSDQANGNDRGEIKTGASKAEGSPTGFTEGRDECKAEQPEGSPTEICSNLGKTLIPDHKYFDALAAAVAAGGSNIEVQKRHMKKLLKCLRNSDILDRDEDGNPTKRAHKAMADLKSVMDRTQLTPVDVPFCIKKKAKMKRPLSFFIDGLAFGATNQPYGGSITESVLQYAERLELPSLKFLMNWYAETKQSPATE